MAGALSGYGVLDLTGYLAGPYCGMMLGDMGAEVIKIEAPQGERGRKAGPPFIQGESAYFLLINRNKKSMTLNLKEPEGKEVFLKLVRKADVLIENFRPGVMERLGIGYTTLNQLNSRLIYGSITGFGSTGPYSDRPAFDHIMQGIAGWMSLTGREDTGPIRVGPSIGDILCGTFSALGISLALLARETTGRGQRVETSLLEGLVATLIPHASLFFATGHVPGPQGNSHPMIVPFGTYQASDGFVNVAVGTEEQWRSLCSALELGDVPEDPRFSSNAERVKNRSAVDGLLAEKFRSQTKRAWTEKLNSCGVPCGPVNTLGEVFSDPQVLDRGLAVEMDHPKAGPIRALGCPISMSQTPAQVRRPPPLLGEHNEEILRSLGYDQSGMDRLRKNKVI